jgi:polyisoprenoid-binding protein YceI
MTAPSALRVSALIAMFAGSSLPALADVAWSADSARSRVTLAVTQLWISKVTGTIPIASGTIVTSDAETVPLFVGTTLDATALTTRDPGRDAQLRGDRFFDVARFPTITFASERIVETGPTTFSIQGALTMRGVTHPLVLDAHLAEITRDPNGKRRAHFTATGRFRRSDYGMNYIRGVVGNDVALSILIEAVH